MDKRNPERIKKYLLENRDIKKRISQRIQQAQVEATVSIGRVGELFAFSDSQLREWESQGLLHPKRSKGGQRLYPQSELIKLAIIRELCYETKEFRPGNMPENLDRIWQEFIDSGDEITSSIHEEEENALPKTLSSASIKYSSNIHNHIDDHTYEMYKDLFWKHYTAMALRLSFYLITEGIPQTFGGFILPVKKPAGFYIDSNNANELAGLGPSLIGWPGQSRTFYTYLADALTFRHPLEYSVFLLKSFDEAEPLVGQLAISLP